MNLRQYVSIMLLGTLLCGAAWVMVLFNVDPFQDAGIGLLFFHVSFFLVLVGICSLVMFGLYHAVSRGRSPMYRLVKKSFVAGVLLAALTTFLLFLRGKGMLNMWNLIIFVGILCFLFLFHLSVRLHHKDQAQI